MPRRARLTLPGIAVHIIQRGNNRAPVFFADRDYQLGLGLLDEQAAAHDCALHAWCLMTNHLHLLLTPTEADGAARMMKAWAQRYTQHVNRTYQRTGTLWDGRFRSCLLDAEGYMLACYRYIELNPVRAGMVRNPADYPWSSHRFNALGDTGHRGVPHPIYLRLGSDDEDRQAAYRELFRSHLAPDLVDQIRVATNGNFALGSKRFLAEASAALGRRITPGKPGRPRGALKNDAGDKRDH